VQINQELNVSSHIPSSKPVALQEGDVYRALVKERLPQNEAVLQIRGQDVKVKFEGELPQQNKVAIEVADSKQAVPKVKTIPLSTEQTTNSQSNAKGLARQLNGGAPVSNGTHSAVNTLLQKGIPLNKETFQQTQNLIDNGPGTIEEKLETITALAKKGLEPTATNLKSAHQALHDKSFASSIEGLLKDIDPDFNLKSQANIVRKDTLANHQQSVTANPVQQNKVGSQTIDDTIKQLKNKLTELGALKTNQTGKVLSRAEKMNETAKKLVNEVLNSLRQTATSPEQLQRIKEVQEGLQQGKSVEQSVQKLLMALSKENPVLAQQLKNAAGLEKTGISMLENELIKLNNGSNNSNAVQQAMSVVKKEANLSEVFQQLAKFSANLSAEQQQMLEASLGKAEALGQSGKELAARQELMSTLTKMNNEMPATQNASATTVEPTEAYKMQEELLSSLPIQSKDFIVERVSKKLSQVAIDFKNFKNDITKSLQTVEQLVQQFKNRATITAKPMLETTIKKLDQAVLRSDFMLYADMKTEKKLLTASTQLAEAKRLLSKGDHSGANRIVAEVKTVIDKMMFKPSDVRVKHYVSQELGRLENLPLSKQVTQGFEQSMTGLKQEPSARNSYEYLRNLGLTHEADHAQALLSKDREGLSPSLKNLLLKMAQNDGELLQSQKADQVLNNLTGQQLLSKNDSSGLQNLMFTLPLLLQDKMENVKVFVNSKNEQEKIDWENCSLFFLFETKKLGEVGIALTSSDRTLSVKIKNDQDGFKERMEPLAELAKERLSDIGYKIGSIQFDALHQNQEIEPEAPTVQQKKLPTMNEKGYDFSV
jgi:hypothetical protein